MPAECEGYTGGAGAHYARLAGRVQCVAAERARFLRCDILPDRGESAAIDGGQDCNASWAVSSFRLAVGGDVGVWFLTVSLTHIPQNAGRKSAGSGARIAAGLRCGRILQNSAAGVQNDQAAELKTIWRHTNGNVLLLNMP